MMIISQHEVQLTEYDLKMAIWRYLKDDLEMDLPGDQKSLVIASNINLQPHLSVKWTRCTDPKLGGPEMKLTDLIKAAGFTVPAYQRSVLEALERGETIRMPRSTKAQAPDQETILKVAKTIHKARQERGFGGVAGWEYEPRDIHELHIHTARAALAALE